MSLGPCIAAGLAIFYLFMLAKEGGKCNLLLALIAIACDWQSPECFAYLLASTYHKAIIIQILTY